MMMYSGDEVYDDDVTSGPIEPHSVLDHPGWDDPIDAVLIESRPLVPGEQHEARWTPRYCEAEVAAEITRCVEFYLDKVRQGEVVDIGVFIGRQLRTKGMLKIIEEDSDA